MRDLGKWIVAKDFKKLPKVQKIAQSGHTEHESLDQGSRSLMSESFLGKDFTYF